MNFLQRLGAHALAGAIALALATSATAARADRPERPACGAVTPQTCAIAAGLGRGINMGDMLDAPREGDWGAKLESGYVDAVAGRFDTVRLPVRWSNHAAATADATLDEAFAARVDQVVDAFLAKGMYVVLDLHHYSQANGDALHPHEAPVDPSVVDARLVNLWRQVAMRYRDRSPKLLFELLNEPHGRLDADAWNALAPRVLAAVRASNPSRAVVIGPTDWNAVPALARLRVPPDRNLIVTVHNYDPFPFTHQGVEYLAKPFPVGTTCCDAGQRHSLVEALDTAARWSKAHGVPVFLGEFGASGKADVASRAAYARMVREEADRRGIPWAWWEFASGFGIYSPKTGQWVEPLRHALLD